jgi:anaerobic selenocysteine-containing dehydrogenase
MSAETVHYRTCPLCEAMCGLEIKHQNGEIRSIRGDAQNSFSRGHICPKAVALQDLHQDPDRLKKPIKRIGDTWIEVEWDEALDFAADHLHALQKKHGTSSVATYVGNPTVHSHGALLMLLPLQQALHTRHNFSAASLDQRPLMLACWEMWGHQALLPIPDLDRTDYFLCIGGNPLVSNGSIMSSPDIRGRLKDIQKRGGAVVVVDPRRSETADVADEHVFIRPGSDVYWVAALVQVVLEEFPDPALDYLTGLDQLRYATLPFTPEAVEARTGVPADTTRRIAREFAESQAACAYGRMGACTQAHGSLTSWLILALNVVAGHFDKAGGTLFAHPAIDLVSLTATAGKTGSFGRWKSSVRGLPEFGGELPTAVLAEEIEAKQIRGMVMHAGNPVLSAPNGVRLQEALKGLDFFVAFDLYKNESNQHAHLILPPTSQLERGHFDLALNSVALRNVAAWSEPLYPKPEYSRHDWELLLGLTTRLLAKEGVAGKVKAKLMHEAVTRLGDEGLIDLLLRLGSYGRIASVEGWLKQKLPKPLVVALLPLLRKYRPPKVESKVKNLTLAELKKHPHGLDLGALQPSFPTRLYKEQLQLAPTRFITALAEREEDLEQKPPKGFLLIGRRDARTNNSWMHNSPRLVKGKNRCTLQMHPDDAHKLKIDDGEAVQVQSRVGQITVPVEISDRLMPSVVSLPHGWGHDSGQQVANKHAGVSANVLTDDAFLDQVSGNAAFNGVPIKIKKINTKPASKHVNPATKAAATT